MKERYPRLEVNLDHLKHNVAKIVEKYGRIDILVNNAGITRDDLFIRMGEDKWNAVINTNLNSAFYVSKPVVKLMMKQRSGAIVRRLRISYDKRNNIIHCKS